MNKSTRTLMISCGPLKDRNYKTKVGDGMRLRSHKGFTLMEVVIAFVLISFIIAMVGISVTDAYTISAKLKELPNTYYAAQDQTEREMDQLSAYVKEKYRLSNEILNTPPDILDPSLSGRLADINNELAAYSTETVTLFGKDVELYKFTTDYTSSTGQQITMHAGVANAELPERPVPIIDEVEVCKTGSTVTTDLYHSNGATLTAAVNYNSKNYSYHFKELYQWYVCTGNFHTAEFADGSRYVEGEPLYSTVYTIYPNYFTLIAGANTDTITIDSSYYGKYLICVVTPLSIEGTMGNSVVSNYVYVSGLPELSGGAYQMVIDASQISVNYNASEEVTLTSVESRFPSGRRLSASGGSAPKLSLIGATTDTDIASAITGEGSYSRFIRFTDATAMQSSGFSTSSNTIVLAVAKNNGRFDEDFLYANGQQGGFGTNLSLSSGSGDSGWQIVAVSFPSGCSSLEVGKCDVDIAELVVVSSPSGDDLNRVWNYLSEKYRITS